MLALCGCTALGQSDGSQARIEGPPRWATYGRGPTHRASYDRGSIPSKSPSADRSYDLNGSVATSPVASENLLAVGDERGILVAPFDDQELPRWVEPPGTVAGTPCLDGETIYVTSYGRSGRTDTAHISALTASGETKWQTELPADVTTMPTIRDGTVFVRSGEGYLALDEDSGETRWRNSEAGQLTEVGFLAFENVGPVVSTDVAVFPDGDGITAVDPSNGSIRWRRRLQKVRSCPVIADETVYVADVKSGVHAFDATTGNREWKWSGVGCWSPPAVSDERVYATETDDVIALDVGSGDLEWRTRNHGLHGGVQSGVSVVGNSVLASSSSLGVACVQAESDRGTDDPGTLRWKLGGRGFNTPIVVADRIVFVEYGRDGPTLRVLK
jgi:outer membrane protein assembly factor BamB